jgi:membrane protease YdiL (CAAX protease family)
MGTLHWNPEDSMLVAGLLSSVGGFGLYRIFSRYVQPFRRLSTRCPALEPKAFQVLLQRIWGILFLMILPLGFMTICLDRPPSGFGLGTGFLRPPPLWSFLIIPVIPAIVFLFSSSPANLAKYPQIRSATWTRGLLVLSAISWVVYLVAYEFLFRGLLLFSSTAVLNPWTAVILNVTLYAFAHIYKGLPELILSVPFGFILCYLTLVTGNIWCAVVLHSIVALSNEWLSLRAQPQMKMVKK